MNWSSRCSPLRILIFILLKCGIARPMLASEESLLPRLVVAASHTALSGDLGVLIIELPKAYRTSSSTAATSISSSSSTSSTSTTDDADFDLDSEEEDYSLEAGQIPLQDPLVLRVLRLNGFSEDLVGEVPLEVPSAPAGVNVSLMVPCGFFSRGGSYALQLQRKSVPVAERLSESSVHEVQMRTTLDVRWPAASLTLEPQHLDTYPSQPVLASLEYAGVTCAARAGLPLPLFSLQLVYCGSSVLACDPRNKSHSQTLYSEQLQGFPSQKLLSLRCEFFGLAGHYALRLRPADELAEEGAPTTSAYIKVEWSDLYVFNVHARAVYPCDALSGISVLFEYPACRLPGDRVRLYGRLRADVDSLAPPSSLHYVAELKAPPGKHSLSFDCELFTERYVEYCFVYISQAYNGAMSEVRVDCIPFFPVKEEDAGGWGQWSQWTPCSSSCVGGTRNRHRFCDTPPPRYGAKFCQGETVQTEACGGSSQLDLHGEWSPGDWECRHGEGLAADRAEVTAVVGPECRCGCSLRLAEASSRQPGILAASSRLCPGRSFWLLQAQAPSQVLRLRLDQARLDCPGAYLRARDGELLIDELLADLSADKPARGSAFLSSGPRLLLEFYNEPQQPEQLEQVEQPCVSGFLAHVSAIPKLAVAAAGRENASGPLVAAAPAPAIFAVNAKVMAAAGRWALWLTPAHLVAASLLGLSFLASLFLALQYACKYRKYQLADDLDSLADNSACSGSMQAMARRARAVSSSTLISEVVSLVRLPRRCSRGHARLDETSADIEEGYESTETQADTGEEEEEEDDDDEKSSGADSSPRPRDAEQQQQSGSQRTIRAVSSVRSTPSRRSSSLSGASTNTLAAVPLQQQQQQQQQKPSCGLQAEVKYARPVKLRTCGPVSPVSEEAASTSEDGRRFSATSASTSLNNGFSPASSSSNSTLRRYSGKESKERRNRERLLQGPGSEFSLANADLEMELDYYDYNVMNAGAAPGSYLGMDPAFLVWIPPFSEAEEEEAVERSSGGRALSPDEYRRMQQQQQQQSSADCIRPRKLLEPGESRLHDEIIMEYKARLGEGALPIQRLLEESRVRVSEESLSSASDHIPNRLPRRRSSQRRPRRAKARQAQGLTPSSESSLEPTNDLDTPRSRRRELEQRDREVEYCEVSPAAARKLDTPQLPRRPRQAKPAELNAAALQREDAAGLTLGIPLAEFARNRQASPVKVHQARTKFDLQSPDLGLGLEAKHSFYELIQQPGDDIKFADEDDEYLDNKALA